jgi:hypothetical protein
MSHGSLTNKKSSKRIRESIIKDGISAWAYNQYKLPWSCEDCVHFKTENQTCTLGMPTADHLRQNQIHSYELSGKVALCRLQEID